jgi:hypothetical protein
LNPHLFFWILFVGLLFAEIFGENGMLKVRGFDRAVDGLEEDLGMSVLCGSFFMVAEGEDQGGCDAGRSSSSSVWDEIRRGRGVMGCAMVV